jgi:glutamate dehydrogenase (NAD(P)+)
VDRGVSDPLPAAPEVMMENCFVFADELGPAKVLHVYEPSIQLKGILVVDNCARGPAIGGVRMAEDVSVAECSLLSAAPGWV